MMMLEGWNEDDSDHDENSLFERDHQQGTMMMLEGWNEDDDVYDDNKDDIYHDQNDEINVN